MRSRRRTVLFALIPTLVCVLAIEIAVRAYDYITQRRSSSARTSWYSLYDRDALLGYRGKPNARQRMGPDEEIVHSPDGFRERRSLEETARMKDRHLVICIGESSTYGLRAGDTSGTYPAQLEGVLRRLSKDD